MKTNYLVLSALLGLGFVGNVHASTGGRGGGHDVGLDFRSSTEQAIDDLNKMREAFPELDLENLKTTLANTDVLVTSDPLFVELNGIRQDSVATNQRDPHSMITVNDQKWTLIDRIAIKRGLGLHEVLSLAGLEHTGDYHLTQKYVVKFGLKILSNGTFVDVPNSGLSGTVTLSGVRDNFAKNVVICEPKVDLLIDRAPISDTCHDINVNEKVEMKPGIYNLWYSYAHQLIRVEGGLDLLVPLSKINFQGSSRRTVLFEVYYDLSAPVELSKHVSELAQYLYTCPASNSSVKLNSDVAALCEAYTHYAVTHDPLDLVGSVVRPAENGFFERAAIVDAPCENGRKRCQGVQWEKVRSTHLANNTEINNTGKFVSVFPNKYVIIFGNDETTAQLIQVDKNETQINVQ